MRQKEKIFKKWKIWGYKSVAQLPSWQAWSCEFDQWYQNLTKQNTWDKNISKALLNFFLGILHIYSYAITVGRKLVMASHSSMWRINFKLVRGKRWQNIRILKSRTSDPGDMDIPRHSHFLLRCWWVWCSYLLNWLLTNFLLLVFSVAFTFYGGNLIF